VTRAPEEVPSVSVQDVDGYSPMSLAAAVTRLGAARGWASTASAFGALIPADGVVLIKPNWVMHRNKAEEEGLTPLVTHPQLLLAIVDAALQTGARRVVVGDAPVQGCDFAALMHATGLGPALAERAAKDPRLMAPVDFRGTKSHAVAGVLMPADDAGRRSNGASLVHVDASSWLEPVSDRSRRFRVTQYDPAGLTRTHSRGKHAYLVARELLDADVVINVPKLKTHRKAGVTGALKNLVGINVDKAYLPHHSMGAPANGGDCYPSPSWTLALQEWCLDRWNASSRALSRVAWSVPSRALTLINRRLHAPIGVEGAWHGNDTVWRMVMDLNLIARFADRSGALQPVEQRRLVHVVDAVVAGDGDGPLASSSLPLGLVLAGESAAALDWVGARLLGFAPERVALVAQAWRVATQDVAREPLVEPTSDEALLATRVPATRFPLGWLPAVDRARVSGPRGIVRESSYSMERADDAA
jgi:uncharacterized protein (DUF362 family)